MMRTWRRFLSLLTVLAMTLALLPVSKVEASPVQTVDEVYAWIAVPVAGEQGIAYPAIDRMEKRYNVSIDGYKFTDLTTGNTYASFDEKYFFEAGHKYQFIFTFTVTDPAAYSFANDTKVIVNGRDMTAKKMDSVDGSTTINAAAEFTALASEEQYQTDYLFQEVRANVKEPVAGEMVDYKSMETPMNSGYYYNVMQWVDKTDDYRYLQDGKVTFQSGHEYQLVLDFFPNVDKCGYFSLEKTIPYINGVACQEKGSIAEAYGNVYRVILDYGPVYSDYTTGANIKVRPPRKFDYLREPEMGKGDIGYTIEQYEWIPTQGWTKPDSEYTLFVKIKATSPQGKFVEDPCCLVNGEPAVITENNGSELWMRYTFPKTAVESPEDSEDVQYAHLKVIPPETNMFAYEAMTDDTNYDIVRTTWIPDDKYFKPNTEYTVEVELEARTKTMMFDRDAEITINGQPVQFVFNYGEGVELKYTFPATAPDPDEQLKGFVIRLYTEVLMREADPVGMEGWIDALKSGRNTGAEAARGFIESKEFKDKNVSDEEYLNIMYRTFFDRNPDPAGMEGWKNVLDEGISRLKVLQGFAESEEFTKVCDRFHIKRGNIELTAWMDKNEGVTKFIARCYKVFLGRKADPDGLNGWTKQLLTEENNAKQAAHGFVMSAEFQNKNLSDREYVRTMYIGLMNRQADEGGLNDWVKVLEKGGSREEIFFGFADSLEFRDLARKYGISGDWPGTPIR